MLILSFIYLVLIIRKKNRKCLVKSNFGWSDTTLINLSWKGIIKHCIPRQCRIYPLYPNPWTHRKPCEINHWLSLMFRHFRLYPQKFQLFLNIITNFPIMVSAKEAHFHKAEDIIRIWILSSKENFKKEPTGKSILIHYPLQVPIFALEKILFHLGNINTSTFE